jgi:hypothetical protein
MTTFEYKEASFYTDYFSKHPDFRVIDDFKLSDDYCNEKNLYVGTVERVGTIHPLILRVEIPITFPHNKLTFRTKSLSGYPHLIHNGENGDWFCLNTPFAETPEEQLNQEVRRLNEWISHQIKSDLPPVIKDPDVRRSLAEMNAYEWEKKDEINEFQSKAMLTFVGDFGDKTANFPEQMGYLHCLKTPDNRYYAFKDKLYFTTEELPYIIVDNLPTSSEVKEDFIQLRDFYGWSDDICKHLLPDFRTDKGWSACKFSNPILDLTEEEAIERLASVRAELDQETSYFFEPKSFLDILNKNTVPQKKKEVRPIHKKLIKEYLNSLEKEIHEKGGIHFDNNRFIDDDDEEQASIDNWIEYGQYVLSHFALGIKYQESIVWVVVYANHKEFKEESEEYDLGLGEVSINRPKSLYIWKSLAQSVNTSMFFGRGALCEELKNKRVALIGLGAIGSLIAESLAHSGISKIGLWDEDIVEPGNICRSAFNLDNIGEAKVTATRRRILSINPFIEINDVRNHGQWTRYSTPQN